MLPILYTDTHLTIINDRVHGDGKQNKIFTQQLHISEMFLHARKLSFVHPVTQELMVVEAGFPEHWERVVNKIYP